MLDAPPFAFSQAPARPSAGLLEQESSSSQSATTRSMFPSFGLTDPRYTKGGTPGSQRSSQWIRADASLTSTYGLDAHRTYASRARRGPFVPRSPSPPSRRFPVLRH